MINNFTLRLKMLILFNRFKGWREILTCQFTYRSVPYDETLVLSNGKCFKIDSVEDDNMKYLWQRLREDVISVIRDLKIDRTELACLKCILLFDPGIYFHF